MRLPWVLIRRKKLERLHTIESAARGFIMIESIEGTRPQSSYKDDRVFKRVAERYKELTGYRGHYLESVDVD